MKGFLFSKKWIHKLQSLKKLNAIIFNFLRNSQSGLPRDQNNLRENLVLPVSKQVIFCLSFNVLAHHRLNSGYKPE